MKDSGIEWIGEIPVEWEMIKTKHCYSNRKEVVGDKADDYERLALTLNGVIKRSKQETKGLQPENFSGYQILRLGELVFKLIDLENISTSRVGYSPYCGIVSPAYIVLCPKEGVYSQYGAYYFLSMWQREIFNHIGDDGVRSSLNASDLLNVPYPMLSFSEQRRISRFLDSECAKIDRLIEQTRASIEEYKKLKQAMITEAVTKGVRGKRKMKDSGIPWIGEIPEEWEIKTVFQIFTQVKNVNIGMQERNLLSLSYGTIKRKDINTTEGLLPASFEGYNIIEDGDIVLRLTDLQNDQKSFRVGLAKERGIITSAYITLRNRSNVFVNYLYYFLHAFDVSKGFYGMGAGIRESLNWDGLKSINVLVPTRSEQYDIVFYLDGKTTEIDNLIAQKESLIRECETYKKGLIYEYTTGKKSV